MAYNYPYGNGQQLNLDWFLNEWKNLLAAWEAEKNGVEGALQAEIDRAEAALSDVFAARDAAAQSAANALESKNAAAQSASDASGYLSTVQQNATAAQNAASAAAQSESNAADSAQTAVASKNAAGQSERNAAQSEANAVASKDAAAQSAADALANKNAAAQSAGNAEDAAASVEASAQQIATNTNNIVDLKETVNNDIITPFNIISLYKTFSFKQTLTASEQYVKLFHNKIIVTKNNTNDIGWFDVHFMLPLSQPTTVANTPNILEENINNFQPLFFDKIRTIGYSTKAGSAPYGFAILISTIKNGIISSRAINASITNGKINEFNLNAEELTADKINISLRLRSNTTSDSGTNNAILIVDFVNANLNPSNNQALALALSN